jgi:DNA primase
LGTALTVDHVALIKRYASEAVVVFDADQAGESAALRSAELLLAAGLGVRIATVPQGKDPDEFLHAHGAEAFAQCLARSVDLAEFQTELALKRRPAELGPAEKSAVAKEVLETISRCPDEIVKGEWLRRLAQRLKVGEESLRLQLSKRGPVGSARAGAGAPATARPASDLTGGDEDLFTDVFMAPELFDLVREADFSSETGRRLWLALSQMRPWPSDWPSRLRETLSSADNSLAQRMLLKADDLDKTDVKSRLQATLARRRAQVRWEELRQTLCRDGKLDQTEHEEYVKLTVELKGSQKK